MKKYTFTDDGYTFQRVDRKAARRAYNNGLRVMLCPVNLRPGYPYHPETSISGKAAATFEKLCNEYRENKRLIEELEAMNDSIKADILAIMGDRETVTEGASKATYKAVTSSRFDSSGFRKVYPDLFTEYSTPTTYRRFMVQ